MLIWEDSPLARLMLKLCITAEPWLGTTTKALEVEEEEYFVLHAIKKPIATRARIATIQVSLVHILRFVSIRNVLMHPPAGANRA